MTTHPTRVTAACRIMAHAAAATAAADASKAEGALQPQ